QIATGNLHTCAVQAAGAVRCWGENGSGQLGDGTTFDKTLPVLVPSVTLNIDPHVILDHHDREATVTILALCEEGQRLRVDVSLTQDGTSADGVGGGKCTGGLARYPVKVKADGHGHHEHGHKDRFDAGPAEVTAVGLIRGHGEVTENQEWTRAVEIVDAP